MGSFNGLQQHLRNKATCCGSYSVDEIRQFEKIKAERKQRSEKNVNYHKYRKGKKNTSSKVEYFYLLLSLLLDNS